MEGSFTDMEAKYKTNNGLYKGSLPNGGAIYF